MRNSVLKNKLRNRELTVGSWLTLPSPAIAEILALAGYEWLLVDLEHSVIPIDVAAEMIRVIDLCGASPLVRPTSIDPDLIKRVMDAGAHGIIVPMVTSEIEMRAAVAATRYAPAGNRGVGLGRAQKYGPGFADYLAWQVDGPVVIAQIEHIAAVEALEEILGVDGVDGLIIGPYDLTASMGIPGQFDDSGFIAAMARIRSVAAAMGKPSGLHVVEPQPEHLEAAIRDGHRFISHSVDFRMLDAAARTGLAAAKEFEA